MIAEDWTLEYPGTTFVFGSCESGYILEDHPELGVRAIVHEDRVVPRTDSRAMGRDFIAPPSLTFPRLSVRGEDQEQTKAMRSMLSAVWRADAIRRIPGAVATLRAPSGRNAFGRPRRFSPSDRYLTSHNISSAVMDFEMADERWYGDASSMDVPFAAPVVGGLVAPLTAPLTTNGPSTVQAREAAVGGELETPFEMIVHGPLTEGAIVLQGPRGHIMRFYLAKSLSLSDVLVIDTRPEVRTVMRNGVPASSWLSARSTPLGEAALRPGSYTVTFEGQSSSGNAYAEVRWRDAFASW